MNKTKENYMREILIGLIFALTFPPVKAEDTFANVIEFQEPADTKDLPYSENPQLPEIDKSTELTIYSPKYNKYRNNAYGYEIIIPNNLTLNEDIVSVKSRFESDDLVVEVFYDNFYNTINSHTTLRNYGNRGILKNNEFTITNEYNYSFEKLSGHITLFERRKVKTNESDRNYYGTITFVKNTYESITVFMKSSTPLNINDIMPEFKFTAKTETLKNDAVFHPEPINFDE